MVKGCVKGLDGARGVARRGRCKCWALWRCFSWWGRGGDLSGELGLPISDCEFIDGRVWFYQWVPMILPMGLCDLINGLV
eukprot:56194-Chlamydomonas_euryale.AAC.6